MTVNKTTKLMALIAMSFSIFTADVQAGVKDDVRKAKSKVLSAASRDIHSHALGIGLGQTFLLGSFDKKGDDQIAADILYTYTASYSFDLLLNAHYSKHEYKKKKVTLRGYTMSIKARSYEFDAFAPFVLGGLGFYMPQITDSSGKTSENKFTFGLNAGAGADLRLNKHIAIGVLGQYHMPFEVKQDETENVRGSYFKLLLTAMYLFR